MMLAFETNGTTAWLNIDGVIVPVAYDKAQKLMERLGICDKLKLSLAYRVIGIIAV